ncbi:diguanylate cyclase domain protein [Burkholderia thailandensis MSMB121]|uniref:putative bifunctional diguanylate cyclase/phosphodiesterase n=1 Tax=Burkholderia humptydooensis TaxID=430531 RepID=UPI0003280F81|nr:EAL domain-containing protein [Burkholderia humptydooensis]AGK50833.1 diguanylate cyclase domain protein [Burkholderia thailandensis MSMB121]ATF32599.1 two-component system response regulator [Burkholderia thailandensis]KST71214.1 diguanylate cyclase [Burkholderia humptydooensis]
MNDETMIPEWRAQTVLVVDDTPANLELAVSALEADGLEVLVAQSGEEAIRRAQLVVPDLVLLDVMMPGIDGFETCRRLKAIDHTRDAPVIFMTALSDVQDKVAGFAAGGIDYLTKPFQIVELAARVKTHLALRAAQQQLVLANARLASSEARYRRLFETASDGIILVDMAGSRITDVNASLVEMLGFERDHFVGRPIGSVPPFEAVPECASLCATLAASGEIRCEHTSLATATGTLLDVEFLASLYTVGGARIVQCNVRDITERKQAEARVRYMALHDALTGLPNRALLQEHLAQAIARARREGGRVAALMLDLDRFKHVNDSLGHHIGDRLLEAASMRLRGCLREGDTVARLGGDEFVIGLADVDGDQGAGEVATRVLTTLSRPFFVENHELHVGCSIGISRYPADGEDVQTLLRAADTAMYDAKANGRGIYRFFTPELNAAAQQRLALARDIRYAFDRGEFVLHYQPQVCTHSGAITGVEALLRWRHPEHGLISPLQFVPMLEELGLIVAVGQWVLRTACQQSVQWQSAGLPPVRMAVNLSAYQLQRGDIVRTVDEALRETGLAAEWLELELTETMALYNAQEAIRIMREFKQLGVSLSLDDFGTGWSSLSYLRQFPIDRIKIDRSFIRDVVTHPGASAVVQGIMTLANHLGLQCIAEGVETVQQFGFLQERACGEIQGFLVSPALPAHECAVLLAGDESPVPESIV